MYEVFKDGVRKLHGIGHELTPEELRRYQAAGYTVKNDGKTVGKRGITYGVAGVSPNNAKAPEDAQIGLFAENQQTGGNRPYGRSVVLGAGQRR
ncbi:hypothetical protein [Papillibacter cinnamivorans]|uniref:hypothetical protein n=1 Tax=Papillibacter cinnamivorans TaxID=100176 RepID=UPI000A07BB1F|nr:hypothetical protein [Papillibacter cinnamivorans]